MGISPQERIHQGHSGGPVNIVVPVNQDLLLGGYGPAHPVDGYVHVLHQERIMQVVKTRPEERAGLLEGLNSPLDKQFGKNAVNPELGGKPSHLLRIRRFLDYPFALFSHIIQR